MLILGIEWCHVASRDCIAQRATVISLVCGGSDAAGRLVERWLRWRGPLWLVPEDGFDQVPGGWWHFWAFQIPSKIYFPSPFSKFLGLWGNLRTTLSRVMLVGAAVDLGFHLVSFLFQKFFPSPLSLGIWLVLGVFLPFQWRQAVRLGLGKEWTLFHFYFHVLSKLIGPSYL